MSRPAASCTWRSEPAWQPERLVLHGNNKSAAELARAIEVGVGRIIVDSFDEIDRLRVLSVEAPAPPKVLVRVTPGWRHTPTSSCAPAMRTRSSGSRSPQGRPWRAVEELRSLTGVDLAGIHAHIGSQVFDVSSFEQAAEILGRFFSPLGLDELCVGGGLGVAYVNGESAPSQAEWAEAVRAACRAEGVAPTTRITAEPGRSIVAGAAITLYRVGTVKALTDLRTYVAVDGGMSDNPRPVLYGSGYEAFLPREANAERPLGVRVVGKHCETGDIVVPEAWLPSDLAIGDILATPVTGAYGYSMASNYNKVPRPPVLFVADGRARVVVRGETLDDLLRLDT